MERMGIGNCKLQIANCKFSRRRGFTLIEILVVITIIGLLLGLLTMGIGQARARARNMRMVAEVKQLATAIERVRNELGGGEYPPDGTDRNDWNRFCRRAFPWANLAQTDPPFDPSTALVFWLGGVRDAGSGALNGFSANPATPFDNTTPSRIGPFYDFDKSRLAGGNYRPQNDLGDSAPILYFKAVNGKYSDTIGVPGPNLPPDNTTERYHSCWGQVPFKDARTALNTGAATRRAVVARGWMNPKSCQILSPGLDGHFGAAISGTFISGGGGTESSDGSKPPLYAPIYPDGVNYPPRPNNYTNDDITNFMQGGKLQDDMPL